MTIRSCSLEMAEDQAEEAEVAIPLACRLVETGVEVVAGSLIAEEHRHIAHIEIEMVVAAAAVAAEAVRRKTAVSGD